MWNKAAVYLKELSPHTQQTEKKNKFVSMADFIVKASDTWATSIGSSAHVNNEEFVFSGWWGKREDSNIGAKFVTSYLHKLDRHVFNVSGCEDRF